MDIMDQILGSQLSKQARTNPSGIFEGTPANVAGVVFTTANIPAQLKASPLEQPIDLVFTSATELTYLEYLKAANQR